MACGVTGMASLSAMRRGVLGEGDDGDDDLLLLWSWEVAMVVEVMMADDDEAARELLSMLKRGGGGGGSTSVGREETCRGPQAGGVDEAPAVSQI